MTPFHQHKLANSLALALGMAVIGSFVSPIAGGFQSDNFSHANLSFYLDKSGNRQRIKTTDDWNKRRLQILESTHLAMGNFPPGSISIPVTSREVAKTSYDEFEVMTIVLTSKNQVPIHADLYVPNFAKAKNAKLPAMLALHPTGSPGKKIIGGTSPKPNRQYANELAKRGYVVIAPDYPSFGDSSDHKFATDGFDSGTMLGIVNHKRCIDFLESVEFVDRDRIGVIGHSLGGHNAIFTAVHEPRLKVIVSSCGWTPFHDYYGGKIAGWTSDRYMPFLKTKFHLNADLVPFDFYELVAALAPRPFFSNAPKSDSNFDVDGVKKAIARARPIYSLFDATDNLRVTYPPCGHDFPSEIREKAYSFIDKALDHQPSNKIGFDSELPRLTPLSPKNALDSFNRRQISLVASEPAITDPIALAFDSRKRMYVVEMKDYSEQEKESLGQVRLLTDSNHDGIYNQSVIFADSLSWPTAIICFDDGVFVGAAPDIFFLKDTDGDGKADIRKKVFSGFGRNNVQGLLNSFRWGLDNRIHGATSSSGGTVYRFKDNPKTGIQLRGRDFSFDPRTLQIQSETGGAQHGMCFDDWGNKYVCSNSDHAQLVLYDDHYLSRNPTMSAIRPRISIADDGGQAPVFRESPVEPWRIVRTRLRVAGSVPGPVEGGGRAAGYFTGSTGITIFRGDADILSKGTAVIGDVGSNIVHRKSIQRTGLDVIASRIDPMSELIASSDNWFRPVQFENGPSGCLYILDMYREVIEHPKSLPAEIKKHLDLTSGKNLGRIYRFGTPKLKRKYKDGGDLKPQIDVESLVEFLDHPNSWHRETAARLIFERQDSTAVQYLQTVRVKNFGELGRLHALYALDGLGRLKLDDLMIACQDADPNIRRHSILLAEKNNHQWIYDTCFKKLVDDPDPQVRLQLAFSIGFTKKEYRLPILWRLLKKSAAHPLMVTAIMSSANDLQLDLFKKNQAWSINPDSNLKSLISQKLISQIAKRNRDTELQELVSFLALQIGQGEINDVKNTIINLTDLNPALFGKLTAADSLRVFFQQQFSIAENLAVSETAPVSNRVDSIAFLAMARKTKNKPLLLSLMNIQQPKEIQLAALRGICQTVDLETATELLAIRKTLGGEVQREIFARLLSRRDWTIELLKNTPASQFPPGVLSTLSKSNHDEVKTLAESLLSKVTNADKRSLIASYQSSLGILGDPSGGRLLFKKHCAACHKAGGSGNEIGPNLASMKNRGRSALLTNVLDPNREINPQFHNYIVQLTDGRTITGMIINESVNSITLQHPENKTTMVPRANIEAIKNTGLSLMPDGLEKEISPIQMADLIEFLMSAQ